MQRVHSYSEVLKSQRKANAFTQEELAAKLHASPRVVRDWESGRHFPSPKNCQQLCKLYGKKDLVELGLLQEEDSSPQTTSLSPASFKGQMNILPPIVPVVTQQRKVAVKTIYEDLIRTDTTVVAITGIRGVGKSTLAALVVAYIKSQANADKTPFGSEPLWLRVDPAFTMVDLMGNIYEFLGKPLPDVSQLTPLNQALMLFRTLEALEKPLLVVLDQFENVLDYQTGSALTTDKGIGEWLDLMNCQSCRSRILLTSHSWPQGVHGYPPIYMKEYRDKGLLIEEGVELLQKQGIDAAEKDLYTAVQYCSGHAFALVLLRQLLHTHRLNLGTLLKDPTYLGLWQGNIARNLLSSLYTPRLSQEQSWLLVAFSLYREPVKLEAARAVLVLFEQTRKACERALDALLMQHLLQAYGEGYYQPHSIVSRYAQDFLQESSTSDQRATRLSAHMKAAQYYLHSIAEKRTARIEEYSNSCMHDRLEAIWHLCQAEQLQEAYDILQHEEFFEYVLRQGKNIPLLEIFQQFLALARWTPTERQMAHIYRKVSEVYNNLWQNDKAQEYCERALVLYRNQEDDAGVIKATCDLGEIYSGLGKNDQAEQSFKEALRAYEEREDVRGVGRMLNNLGWICFVRGERTLALQYYTRALEMYRHIGDRCGEGNALSGLGLVSNVLKQQQKALDYYTQALSIRREVSDHSGEGRTLNGLGLVYRESGQSELALHYFEQALRIHTEAGERGGEGRILNNIGLVHVDLGHEEQALNYYTQALLVCGESQDRGGQSWVLTNIGKLYQRQGLQKQALYYYSQALELSKSIGDREGEGNILCSLGTLYAEQKNYSSALTYFLHARQLLEGTLSQDLDMIQNQIECARKCIGKLEE